MGLWVHNNMATTRRLRNGPNGDMLILPPGEAMWFSRLNVLGKSMLNGQPELSVLENKKQPTGKELEDQKNRQAKLKGEVPPPPPPRTQQTGSMTAKEASEALKKSSYKEAEASNASTEARA